MQLSVVILAFGDISIVKHRVWQFKPCASILLVMADGGGLSHSWASCSTGSALTGHYAWLTTVIGIISQATTQQRQVFLLGTSSPLARPDSNKHLKLCNMPLPQGGVQWVLVMRSQINIVSSSSANLRMCCHCACCTHKNYDHQMLTRIESHYKY